MAAGPLRQTANEVEAGARKDAGQLFAVLILLMKPGWQIDVVLQACGNGRDRRNTRTCRMKR